MYFIGKLISINYNNLKMCLLLTIKWDINTVLLYECANLIFQGVYVCCKQNWKWNNFPNETRTLV